MKYLLDTHTLLWYLLDDKNLSKKARDVINTQECFYSLVSLWEIAIKQSIGKLRYKETIPSIVQLCGTEDFILLYPNPEHIENTKYLPYIHKDPFDRLLISQAATQGLTLITKDDYIKMYDIATLW